MSWKLKDKNGKYRSRRAFKQDLKQDSQEEWERRRTCNPINKLRKKVNII